MWPGPPILGPERVQPGRLSVSLSLNWLIFVNYVGIEDIWRCDGQDGEVRREQKLYHC